MRLESNPTRPRGRFYEVPMHTKTGEIQELRPDEAPDKLQVRLTPSQAAYLARLPRSKRALAFAKAVHRFAQAHPASRPDGLTNEEWRAQQNAAKAIRRARSKRRRAKS